MRIAILGAESSGKTTLAAVLAERLAVTTGRSCVAVGEFLREWCDREGRTPRADEQAAIAAEQAARVERAAATHDIVVADTTPLMTAIYSDLLFADRSLYPMALEQQRGYDATLVTALDLPWVADGLQRDGPQVRQPVDARLRAALESGGIAWSLVSGSGDRRLDAAFDALR